MVCAETLETVALWISWNTKSRDVNTDTNTNKKNKYKYSCTETLETKALQKPGPIFPTPDPTPSFSAD